MYFVQSEIDAFWQNVAPAWNRQPALIKRPFSKPFVSEAEFLGFLHRWAQEGRDGRRMIGVHLVDADVLPRPEDRSLEAFEQRIADRWSKDWYLYLSDGVQGYDGRIWERAVEVIRPALRLQGGLPAGGMMLDLFYGKYRSTPTGIHLDSSDNLAFVVRGPKRLMFWPPERFAVKFASPPVNPSHQQALTGRYAEHLAEATIIDAEAGDVIYWPKEFWHLSTSDNWSGMVTLPIWWNASAANLARTMVPKLLDLRGESRFYDVDVDDAASAASELPAALGDMVTTIKGQVAARLESTARIAWAKFVTAYGFTTPPAPREAAEVTEATRIRVTHPVAAIDLGRAIAVIACGQQMVTPCMSLIPVVRSLRPGSEHGVADLDQRLAVADADASRSLTQMVSQLVGFRALDVIQ
jgi:hypothetical protein